MTCRRSMHGPENMSDRRADRTEPVTLCGGESTRVCRGHLALLTAGKSGEKSPSLDSDAWARSKDETSDIVKHTVDVSLRELVTLLWCFDKQRACHAQTWRRRKAVEIISDLHIHKGGTSCGTRMWLILVTHSQVKLSFGRNRADWSNRVVGDGA